MLLVLVLLSESLELSAREDTGLLYISISYNHIQLIYIIIYLNILTKIDYNHEKLFQSEKVS